MSFRPFSLRVLMTLFFGTFFLGCTGNINKGVTDVFMVTLVSELREGVDVLSGSTTPVISGDGRQVAFVSISWFHEAVSQDGSHIYVRDRVTGVISLVTWAAGNGAPVDMGSNVPKVTSMSWDGRNLPTRE